MNDISEGWGFIEAAKKWHYYQENGVSLCRKYMKLSLTGLEQGGDRSPDNCKRCVELKLKRDEPPK